MKNITIIFLLALLFSCIAKSKSSTEKESKRDSTFSTNVNQSIETNTGIIFFSSNNGLTWESKNEGLPDTISIGLGGIAISNNSLAIATKEKGIFLFNKQKNCWENIPTDHRIIESNPGALTFYQDRLYIGTQLRGVFYTADMGKSWTNINSGLGSLTIRKLVQIDNKLYAATNAGLYFWNETGKKWELEYRNAALQVNGLTDFDGSIYIATNQGAFTTPKNKTEWKQILANRSLHNISSDDKTIYAIVYNELLSSIDIGQTWQNV